MYVTLTVCIILVICVSALAGFLVWFYRKTHCTTAAPLPPVKMTKHDVSHMGKVF